MATKIFETETLTLQDGSEVEVRPLNIKRLRRFMEIVDGFQNVDNQVEAIEIMVRACAVAVEASRPDLVENEDLSELEEILDVPTMYHVLEIAGGIKMDDENLATRGRPGRI